MKLFKMFMTPYMDADTGTSDAGASTQQADTSQQSTMTGEGTPQTEQMFKLKYNHEEREIPYSQAVELAQKGMNYDKTFEKLQSLENNPGLSWITQQAQRYNMTVDQFVDAMKQQEEQEQLNQLIQNNIPREYAEKLMKVDQLEQWKQSFEQRQKQSNEYEAFLNEYPEFNDPQKVATIPPEVWQMNKNGLSLIDAYARYENKMLKQQLTTFNSQQQAGQAVADKNSQNAKTSTGSAKSDGPVPGDFISKETFEQHKGDMKWVQSNYEKLMKSQKKWFK